MDSMDERTDAIGWLQWEWLAARITLALGLGLALVAAVWFGFVSPRSAAPAEPTAAPAAAADNAGAASASQPDTAAVDVQQAGQQFCTSTIGVAKDAGVVPASTKPAGDPQKTDTNGRYVCAAEADAAKYTITVDLMCKDVSDARCFNLYSIVQSDGSSLYQRQD